MLTLLLALPALAPLQDRDIDLDDELRRYQNRINPIVVVVQEAAPAVVYIQTESVVKTQDFWGRIGRRRLSGSGSGVVILKEGFIVTNYHVVRGAQKITVSFDAKYDERVYEAELISYVESEDLALLKIERPEAFPTVPMGTSSDLMPGEQVVAIGNPYGQTHTVSTGIISGLHRNVDIQAFGLEFDDLIQTDASINPGNSGGPLLNVNGELIGINNALNTEAENIGFAIPIDRVRSVLDDQLLAPTADRAWLGFRVEERGPLRVSEVFAGGPAASAGLRKGDEILAIAECDVEDADSYRLARLGLAPGAKVPLRVRRGSDQELVELWSWNRQDGLLFERLGIRVERVVLNGKSPFVRIASVYEGGPAGELGLQPGDLIDGLRPQGGAPSRARRIRSPKALAGLVSNLAHGTELEIDVYRDLDEDGRYERSELHRGALELR